MNIVHGRKDLNHTNRGSKSAFHKNNIDNEELKNDFEKECDNNRLMCLDNNEEDH